LHRISLGETDRIVTLLTPDHGKINAVAKGARRAGSKLSGATELFTQSRMLLAVGKSLDVIAQCEVSESFPVLRADLNLLARATYACELVDHLMEEREPDSEAYDLLLSTLYLLQRSVEIPDVVLHAFELRLLAIRGYAPRLDGCARCDGELGRGRVAFSPSVGGALCADCRFGNDAAAVRPETLAVMQTMLVASPEAIIELTPPERIMAEVGRCLKWYIRYRLDRELRSVEFLDMLRHTAKA
jgi:DNA repair protein RecO (recombination protein O)